MLNQADIARIRSCDLNLLLCLAVLIEEQSVSKSAERLGLSQPAMSQNLKKLHKLFDEPLFVKQSQGIAATEKAQNLYQPLHQWLQLSSRLLLQKPFLPEEATGKIRFSMVADVAEAFVPQLLARMMQDAPNVELEFIHKPSDIFAMLESGDLDIAAGGVELPPPNVYGRRTSTERYLVFFSPEHPLAGLKNPTLADVFAFEHARYSSSNLVEQQIDQLAQEQGFTRRCSFSSSSILVLLQSLKAGRHLAFLPERFLRRREQLSYLEFSEIPWAEGMLYWHARVHKDPLIQWFKDLCLDLVQEMIAAGSLPHSAGSSVTAPAATPA